MRFPSWIPVAITLCIATVALADDVRVLIGKVISAGEHKAVDLGLADGPFSLSGTAPPFSWIELDPLSEESSFFRRNTASGADGKYEFRGLDLGAYKIEAHSRGSALTGYMGRKIKSVEIVIDSDRTENVSWR